MKSTDPLAASPDLERIGITDNELARVHIYPSHESIVAIDQLNQQPVPVFILPHSSMGLGDIVKLTFQGFRGDNPPTIRRWSITIETTDTLIEFRVPDSEFSVWKGNYIKVNYTVLAKDSDEIKFTSSEQRFDIVKTYESDNLLEPPTIPDTEDGFLNPALIGAEGATVTLRYDDVEEHDEGVLLIQAFNGSDSVVANTQQWRRANTDDVNNKRLNFTIEKAWFEQLLDHQLKLSAQIATTSFARSSKPGELTVKKSRILPAPSLAGAVNGEVAAIVIRQAAVLQIPKDAEIQDATVLGCVSTEQGTLLASVVMKPPTDKQDNVIAFPEALFSSHIGESLNWYYEVCDGITYERSLLRNIKLNNLPLSSMPAIQCVETYGEDTLALKNLMPALSGASLKLNRWPFMKQGQIVNIKVSLKYEKERKDYAFEQHLVSADDVKQGAVVKLLPREELLKVQHGSHMVITAQVAFRNGGPAQPFKSVTLQLID
ncbi:hypothetical protein [Pseudomonas urmiensis]|uniref:Uncharacterized protein n=1 Tax=Pseudomonas urmiensis TaxID=2745493 RepID=A0A923JYL3_9PSED|nr:hypothetical protein [Pseudomonas urmiensis]MBV4537281.1 hypothetical protein [Pseudomonas urmiensis]